jgi:hypothetical protein
MLSEMYVRVLAGPVGGPHSTVIFLPNPKRKKGQMPHGTHPFGLNWR